MFFAGNILPLLPLGNLAFSYNPRVINARCTTAYPDYSQCPMIHDGSPWCSSTSYPGPSMGATSCARANDSLDMLSGVRIQDPRALPANGF